MFAMQLEPVEYSSCVSVPLLTGYHDSVTLGWDVSPTPCGPPAPQVHILVGDAAAAAGSGGTSSPAR